MSSFCLSQFRRGGRVRGIGVLESRRGQGSRLETRLKGHARRDRRGLSDVRWVGCCSRSVCRSRGRRGSLTLTLRGGASGSCAIRRTSSSLLHLGRVGPRVEVKDACRRVAGSGVEAARSRAFVEVELLQSRASAKSSFCKVSLPCASAAKTCQNQTS